MKATINGTIVEGTPKEVWELIQQADAQGTNLKPVSPMPSTIDRDWVKGLPQITSGGTGRCPNGGRACFCTGECNGTGNPNHFAQYAKPYDPSHLMR